MAVLNVHKRAYECSERELGELIDTLGSEDDRLWPRNWPRIQLDRSLSVGAVGGHQPMRYEVSRYEPGKSVRFGYLWPRKFNGFHEFSVSPSPDGTAVLQHTLSIRPRGWARLFWLLVIRPLHDACIEDSLDCAEREIKGTVTRPAQWSRYVRFLYLLRDRRHWN